jgi:hypothetical protein
MKGNVKRFWSDANFTRFPNKPNFFFPFFRVYIPFKSLLYWDSKMSIRTFVKLECGHVREVGDGRLQHEYYCIRCKTSKKTLFRFHVSHPSQAYAYEELVVKSEFIGRLPDVDGHIMECYATPSLSEPNLLTIVEFMGDRIEFYTRSYPTKDEVEACVSLFREQKDGESPAMLGINPEYLSRYLSKHT